MPPSCCLQLLIVSGGMVVTMQNICLAVNTNIRFPNLGIELENVPTGFTVFGIHIAFYGVIITLGMVCGFLLAEWQAKRSGQDKELYLDFALYAILLSVVGARLFYVVFNWSEFADNPLSIFNLRTGGLAIYGGIIMAILTGIVYCRIKKYSFFLLADTGMLGLLLGQIIGRWGNFFNREVFGGYTNSLFAMQLNLNDVSSDFSVPIEVLANRYEGRTKIFDRIVQVRENIQTVDGISYVQVHPTFLYESVWNLGLLLFLIIYWKHKKFDGEILFIYLAGYGLGRMWIEGMRTDQLFLWGTAIPVFQALSLLLLVFSVGVIAVKRIRLKKK